MNISVCIATHRRPDRLAALLGDLAQQHLLPFEVVVVDNDASGSGKTAVEQARDAGAPFPIRYRIEPRKNVAHARNRTIELAQGDWLAFVDDDERAPANWLDRLAQAASRFDADGVLGPVEPILPPDAPAWLRRGSFYDWTHLATGTEVPRNRLRLGNLLLRRAALCVGTEQFDPAYGLTGGEDGDWLSRVAAAGARLVWCDEAEVQEPVEHARLSLRWLLLRSLRGGQDFARHALAGRYGAATGGHRFRLLVRALAQMLLALVFALLCLPLGLHRSAHWLTRASANLGKASAFLGLHYREYA